MDLYKLMGDKGFFPHIDIRFAKWVEKKIYSQFRITTVGCH